MSALLMAFRVASVMVGPGEELWFPPCMVGVSELLKDRAWFIFCAAVVIPFTIVGLSEFRDEGGVEK